LTLADAPILETPRLRLRPHRAEDFDAYAAKLGFAPYAETTDHGDPVTMLERPRLAPP
jgi:RimJ/RimL family protein N-acetyltransferase